jgi:hypothetical protein
MTTPETDRFLSEVARLISIATSVINEHVNDQGLCAVCGSAWWRPESGVKATGAVPASW